jgi:hypothetical protein
MQHGRNRKLKALAAALTVAALAAPATQASIDTDARHQALVDKVQQAQVDARHQALLRHGEQGPVVYVTKGTQQVTSSGGTDWGNAGIGAGAAFGVVLIAAAGAFVGRKKLVSA